MRCEKREGMGSGFPYDRNYFPVPDVDWQPEAETELVAQEILKKRGRPFTRVWQECKLEKIESWRGFGIKVQVGVKDRITEGWAVDRELVSAYMQAYSFALAPHFPEIWRIGFPRAGSVHQNGHQSIEFEFSAGSQRWVSRSESKGLLVSYQETGRLVAEGLMAGVHLINGVKHHE